MTAQLQLRVRPRPGAEYAFESVHAAVRVGRGPGCDLAFTGPEAVLVSWEHVRLDVGPDGVTVRDLGSSNGTYVNGRRIDGPTLVRVGDEIGLGQVGPRLDVAAVLPPSTVRPPAPAPVAPLAYLPPGAPADRHPVLVRSPLAFDPPARRTQPAGKALPSATRLLLLGFQQHQRKWWWGAALLGGMAILTVAVVLSMGGKSLFGLGQRVDDLAERTGDVENRLQVSEAAVRELFDQARSQQWKITAVERTSALLAEEARRRDQRQEQLAQEALQRDERLGKLEDQAKNIPARGEDIHRRLLASVVWIWCLNKKGDRVEATGTGSLVDRDLRLVLTAHHVVCDGPGYGVLFFPHRDSRGQVIREKQPYWDNPGAWGIRYHVVVSEAAQDLAVLEIDSVPPAARELPLAAGSPPPGSRVHTTGNPGVSAGLWAYTTGTVKQVARVRMALGTQQLNTWVLETQNPINGGDSGGPLVNDQGEQVAACSYTTNNLGKRIINVHTSFIDLFEIKSILTRVRRAP